MLLPILRNSGNPELEAVLAEYAAAIGRLERLIGSLAGSGGIAGCNVGVVQAGGITAAVDAATPGYGTMEVMQVYADTTPGRVKLRGPGPVVPVFNIAKGTLGGIAEGNQIATIPIVGTPGHQLVILDPDSCPPT